MSLSREDSRTLDEGRESLTRAEGIAVDEAFADIARNLREQGIQPAMDDRAATLEAALIRYVIASREAGGFHFPAMPKAPRA